MKKTYQIRYNTHSKNDSTSWRLICGDEEILVSEVYITAKTFTTKDFMEELREYKYHISCTGNLKIRDNVAYIYNYEEQTAMKRHIAKTITYRILATAITIVTAYSLGVNLEMSALLGVGELVIKPVFYFFHERIWYNFRFKKHR